MDVLGFPLVFRFRIFGRNADRDDAKGLYVVGDSQRRGDGLERVLRNSFNLTPESLRKAHPDLTKGDIRTYILSQLKFSVSEQAILPGISHATGT